MDCSRAGDRASGCRARPGATDAGCQPAQQAQAQKSPFVFASDGGMILNFIKPDKAADFEMLVAKLKEALAKSEKPERKAQAAAWKLFKAADPARAARSSTCP